MQPSVERLFSNWLSPAPFPCCLLPRLARLTAREGATDRWPFNRHLSFAHLLSFQLNSTKPFVRCRCLRSRDVDSVASHCILHSLSLPLSLSSLITTFIAQCRPLQLLQQCSFLPRPKNPGRPITRSLARSVLLHASVQTSLNFHLFQTAPSLFLSI